MKPAHGLTVGELRKALEGVEESMMVTVRFTTINGELKSEDYCGGILSADTEDNCGGLHFAIDCSDDESDFAT